MRPTDHLQALAAEDWRAATDHAFCNELAAGTLPAGKMRWYLVQDYKFIDGFVRLLASAIATAPSLADSVPAAQFLAVITGPENMPVFGDKEITPAQKLAVIKYITEIRDQPNPGGAGLGRVGPVTETAVAWLVGIGGLVIITMWIGSKV